MFRIHREGYRIFTAATIFLLLLDLIVILLVKNILIEVFATLLFFLLIIFIANFFRKPERKTAYKDNIFYSPADGKVVVIEETYEDEYLKEDRIQVSIFMSVWDVHINFFPFSGKVIDSMYHKGKYLVARHPKSSTLNERTTVVIQRENGVPVLLRQIAGAVARRIICYAKPGKEFQTGEELGFIKFGSRVDIFFPKNTEILVKMGDHVTGSVTPIAIF